MQLQHLQLPHTTSTTRYTETTVTIQLTTFRTSLHTKREQSNVYNCTVESTQKRDTGIHIQCACPNTLHVHRMHVAPTLLCRNCHCRYQSRGVSFSVADSPHSPLS
eukprot:scpid109793/ scgid7034/ 